MGFERGQPIYGFPFTLVNRTTGAPVTTGTVIGYVVRDGGTQAALTGTITHEGNGQWTIDEITGAEMDGASVGLTFIHSDAVPRGFTIKTSLGEASSPPSGAWDEDTLTDIRDRAASALRAAMASPKPNYSIGGQSVSWNTYYETLRDTIQWATDQINLLMNAQSGPGHEETYV